MEVIKKRGQKRPQDFESIGNESFEDNGARSSRHHIKNELDQIKPKRNMRQTIIDPGSTLNTIKKTPILNKYQLQTPLMQSTSQTAVSESLMNHLKQTLPKRHVTNQKTRNLMKAKTMHPMNNQAKILKSRSGSRGSNYESLRQTITSNNSRSSKVSNKQTPSNNPYARFGNNPNLKKNSSVLSPPTGPGIKITQRNRYLRQLSSQEEQKIQNTSYVQMLAASREQRKQPNQKKKKTMKDVQVEEIDDVEEIKFDQRIARTIPQIQSTEEQKQREYAVISGLRESSTNEVQEERGEHDGIERWQTEGQENLNSQSNQTRGNSSEILINKKFEQYQITLQSVQSTYGNNYNRNFNNNQEIEERFQESQGNLITQPNIGIKPTIKYESVNRSTNNSNLENSLLQNFSRPPQKLTPTTKIQCVGRKANEDEIQPEIKHFGIPKNNNNSHPLRMTLQDQAKMNLSSSYLANSKRITKNKKHRQSLHKSLVEDASEDFSNIEEHMGRTSFITQNNVSNQEYTNKIIANSKIHISQQAVQSSPYSCIGLGTGTSRTQAMKSNLTANHGSSLSNLFGNTLDNDNSSMFDENVNKTNPIINQSMGSSKTTIKDRMQEMIMSTVTNPFVGSQRLNRQKLPSNAHKKASQKVLHKAKDLSNYTTTKNKVPTLFHKVVMETQQEQNTDSEEDDVAQPIPAGRKSSPQRQLNANPTPKKKLNDFVTKVEETKIIEDDSEQQVSSQHNKKQKPKQDLHRSNLIQTLQSLQYMKQVQQPDPSEINRRSVELPMSRHKKTLIFDLDETLVHCIDEIETTPYDLPITVKFPEGEVIQAGINIRPYTYECVKKAQQNYQIVIFTASHKAYADVVLDTLEKEFKQEKYLTQEEKQLSASQIKEMKSQQKLFDYRLYRDHCIKTPEGIYIKDLRIINNRDLTSMIIVDNAVYSFGHHLDNGIPIIPFYSNKSNPQDEELMHLIYYLNCIAPSPDVRVQNRKAFQLKDLQEHDIVQHLKSMQQQNESSQSNCTIDEEDQESDEVFDDDCDAI